MKPGVREININAWAPRLDVDNRISLHFYYRIADNLLKQASIYREEKNLIDLYIILLRFSSLLCDTIPSHRDYRTLCLKERSTFKKKLLDVINELEALKPVVHRDIDERNRGQIASLGSHELNSYPSTATQTSNKAVSQTSWKYNNGHSQLVSTGQTQISKQIQKPYLNLPYPKEETLSRHSILGPGGLGGHYSEPITGIRVQYPSNADLKKTENFRIPLTNQINTRIDKGSEQTAYSSEMASVLSLDDGRWSHSSEPSSVSVELMPEDFNLLNIKQPSPPPVLAHVQPQQAMVPIPSSKIADPRPGPARTSKVEMPDANTYQHLHIPVQMMEYFLRLAEKNTAKNLETCGILAGSLKERRFCITTLIIPKQEATSDSCQTINEEEIFDYQDKRSLFPLGWIHTHPSQTCFMSSVDLHTHYSYQIMLPEAIAIVMAPTDETRKHGIFHLSDPGGVSVIRNCQERGFHPHEEPSDGSPLYEHCSHVYLNPNLKFEFVDLR